MSSNDRNNPNSNGSASAEDKKQQVQVVLPTVQLTPLGLALQAKESTAKIVKLIKKDPSLLHRSIYRMPDTDVKRDLHLPPQYHVSPLYAATVNGADKLVETMLELGADPSGHVELDPRNTELVSIVMFHNSPLPHAVGKSRMALCKSLVEHGADVVDLYDKLLDTGTKDQKYQYFIDAMIDREEVGFLAICLQHEPTKTRMQLAKLKHLNSAPLIVRAVHHKSLAALVVLGENGFDVDATDGDGNTALHIAAMDSKKIKLAEYLLTKGANPTLRNTDDQTPCDMAISKNAMAMAQLFQRNTAAGV